uniref:Retrovirus-related Pol polyprotein from transposon TNT 1-94 n=1 Tax=Tanacetum cinerariifolium TaxID=118510 RepID=A0A699GMD3_TANCI|nr:retrovirus-related Pol polyprotein from transposon TNT 1-94 [Tanacetum cinerariifolium]
MPIPNELISNNIRNAPYYNAYLEMVAKHDQKVATKKEGKKKTASAKQPKSKPAIEKSSKPAPALKPKATKERHSKASTAKSPKPMPAKENSTKTTLPKQAGKDKISKAQSQAHAGGMAIREPVAEATQPLLIVEGNGKAIVTEEQAAHSPLALHMPKKRSTMEQFIFQRQTPAIEASLTRSSAQAQDDISANIVRDSPSFADAKIGVASEKTNSGGDTEILQIDEAKGKDVDEQVNLEEKTDELDQGQAGSDPDLRESRRALAGPDPEPTHDEFMTNLYPKVQESLKFPDDEHVILDDPISSTGTLFSIKNLEDAYVVGDQFINDKSTKDEPRKPNVEAKVVSMVTVLISQASYSVSPLSTPIPVIDISPLKPASSITQAPIFTATTTTLPPPPQQQSTTESELVARVTLLEKKLSDLEETNKTLDKTSQNLGSRVFNLELRDLPHKIDEAIRESVREAIHPQASQSSTWKKFDTRDAPTSVSEQQSDPHAEQPIEDIPMPDTTNISDSKDTDSTHLPKIKQRPEWLKPLPDDKRPATLKPAWVIPTSYIPDVVNNWDNALATTYQAPVENSLLEKTGDMQTFMHWYCQQIGKTELTQADFEGQSYEVVKAFYPDVVHFQFQIKERHKMLTDQIDQANPEGDQVRIDISKPLPLSGPPGHMKAARYLDFGLKLLIPEHLWISEVVRTHMRILSVIGIKAYSRYGYDYLKEITLRRADYQEYTIAEKDFKKLYPSDFEDLDMLLLQVVFLVGNNEQKIMRFNEIYKFSDGTLMNIMEALDLRVKEYKVNRLNPGLNTRFWTDKDVERSKEFIHAIERRLKTRRIF